MIKLLVFSFLLLFCGAEDPLAEVVAPNEDTIQSPSKEVVVQHPVTVSVHEPQPMTTRPPIAPLKTRVVVVHNNMVPVPIECFQPPDSGTCSKDLARIYYDHETRTCKPFSYTGCGGNANRFQSIKNCYRICHPYRYKIRPKIASKDSQHMKVRVVPAKQDLSSAAPQAPEATASLPQQQQSSPQARSLYGRPGYSQYPKYPQYPPQYPPQYQYPQYQGRQIPVMTQRHVVMTPYGPQIKNQRIGKGSHLPNGNLGELHNYAQQ